MNNFLGGWNHLDFCAIRRWGAFRENEVNHDTARIFEFARKLVKEYGLD